MALKENNIYKFVYGWLLKQENLKYSSPIIKAYSLAFIFIFLPVFGRQRKNNIWVVGSKIYSTFSELSDSTLISTPKDIKKLKKFPQFFGQFYRVYFLIYLSLVFKQKIPLNIAYNIIDRSVKKYSPSIIIVNSTKDPFNRLIIKVAKERKIKTICVQHGIFNKSIPDDINEDDIIDKYIAINENQKKIIARKISEDKIKVLTKATLNTEQSYKIKNKKVCLVGEDWERYGENRKKKIIIDFYIELIKAINKSGPENIELLYRPHPSELKLYNIEKYIELSIGSKENIDIFIGFSSTLLWDMAVKGRACIQIYSDIITDINFDEEEICEAINFDNDPIIEVIKFIENPKLKYNLIKSNIAEDFK